MTVKELKAKLANVNDDVKILVDDSEWGCEDMAGFYFANDDVIIFTSENADYLE